MLVPSTPGSVVGLPPAVPVLDATCRGADGEGRAVGGRVAVSGVLSMSASSVQPPQIERTAPRKRAMKECLLIYLMIVRL